MDGKIPITFSFYRAVPEQNIGACPTETSTSRIFGGSVSCVCFFIEQTESRVKGEVAFQWHLSLKIYLLYLFVYPSSQDVDLS